MQIRFIRTLLFGFVVLCMSAASFAQIGVAITIGPPPIPIYEQPVCPGDGYLWTPGYWAYDYDFDDYYWVPGTWVMAPEVGFLWTPGWWGWGDGAFLWHEGYWGPTVGFYGGIDYGFGYFGVGFAGGRWDGGHFFYNRAVVNVNVTEIHNVYNETVVNNNNHVSFNGGNGGVNARPTAQEEAAAHERHIAPVAAQTQHAQAARSDPQQRASANMGKPAVAATPRPGDFKGSGVVQAKEAGGHYTPPANRGGNQARGNAAAPRGENNAERPSAPAHVRDLPPAERPASSNPGDKKYQQQQEKLYNQQQKERQKVAQQQEKEDQKLAKQNASEAQKQQQEQRHQQQTTQLQQKHQQQQQHMQQKTQPAPRPEGHKPPG
ncbi:MAG: YXWGXW repeat-containing protein [Candidatus Angelobacter sp.]